MAHVVAPELNPRTAPRSWSRERQEHRDTARCSKARADPHRAGRVHGRDSQPVRSKARRCRTRAATQGRRRPRGSPRRNRAPAGEIAPGRNRDQFTGERRTCDRQNSRHRLRNYGRGAPPPEAEVLPHSEKSRFKHGGIGVGPGYRRGDRREACRNTRSGKHAGGRHDLFFHIANRSASVLTDHPGRGDPSDRHPDRRTVAILDLALAAPC